MDSVHTRAEELAAQGHAETGAKKPFFSSGAKLLALELQDKALSLRRRFSTFLSAGAQDVTALLPEGAAVTETHHQRRSQGLRPNWPQQLHAAEQHAAGWRAFTAEHLLQLVLKAQPDQALLYLQAAQAQQSPLALEAWKLHHVLLTCASRGYEVLVRQLLDLGVDPQLDEYGSGAFLALTVASMGHSGVVEVLVQAGAPVTPALVSAAIRSMQLSTLAVLLRQGPLPIEKGPVGILRRQYPCPVLSLLKAHAGVSLI